MQDRPAYVLIHHLCQFIYSQYDNIISNSQKLTFNHRSEKQTRPLQNIVVFMRCVIFHKEISYCI